MNKIRFLLDDLRAIVLNLALAMGVMMVCRLEYWLENLQSFSDLESWGEILNGAWRFDLSAVLYLNVLYAVMMLVPLHVKYNDVWRKVQKWIFVITNTIGVVMNLGDSVYFKYTMRRTTASVFQEFSNESNLLKIFATEIVNHWYLFLLGAALIFALWKLFSNSSRKSPDDLRVYYPVQTVVLGAMVYLTVCGMRGGFTTAVRPLTVSNANQYASKPSEAALILNTPFSLLRTIGKKAFVTPDYFSKEELEAIYTPLHTPSDSVQMKKKNVVVLIVESFGREYIGALNRHLEGGKYKGYTPFVDSLISQSLTFEYSYCNGRKSIDGMPSILSSIPMFVEPFFLTPASMNSVSGLAGELKKVGYYSAFFHGAQNGSMGFQAFSHSTGFTDYFGRTEYDADKRFGGENDFDGTWAIWDEPFLQFYAKKMSDFREPFMTALFTASSHHPYVVPEKYKDVYREEGLVIHKCIRYVDNALRQFFATAKKQKWYDNTIFVITSDHTNLSDHPEYQTDLGGFASPIIFFDPGGEMPRGMSQAIAQQIDIMPTLLGYLGYDHPYVAFGCDLLTTPPTETFAVNYLNGIYQYVKSGYVLQFDGERTRALYSLSDRLMRHNLIGKTPQQHDMERELKAIIQQYMSRMNEDGLVVKK